MNKILIALMSLILVGCSVANPKLSFGKKCVDKGDQIHYSYVWIYDKNAGLIADETTCKLIDNQD
jgi:hypothetical protein